MTTDPGDDCGDAALLRASQQDPEAFGRFYDRHATDLLRCFYRRTACAQTAADLTAETFAQAFAARGRFRDLGVPARAWLFAIARHQLAREARGRRVSDRYRRRLGMQPVAVDDLSLERIAPLPTWHRPARRSTLPCEPSPKGRPRRWCCGWGTTCPTPRSPGGSAAQRGPRGCGSRGR
jgi:DNA-directed RNA polymerase specialized sigma24 family protein